MGRLALLVEAIELKPFKDLSAAESERILAIRNEAEVRKNMYTDHEIGLDEHRIWMERTVDRADMEMFAVVLEGQIAGAVGLSAIVSQHARAEWAFYLSQDIQGKGLGSALEFKFLEWAFGERGLHKLNCEVLSFNTAVIGLHKKFGFHEEGVRREHIYRDDEWIDTVLLGITQQEWVDQSAAMRQRLFK